jgi:hypothetical protein
MRILLLLIFLSSCTAQYHLRKYQNKGGICGRVDTIRVTKYDTINHRYYYKDSLILVNDRVIPMTRQEVRYEYKLKRDTIHLKETQIKYLYKQQKAEIKKEKSKSTPLNLFLILLIMIAAIVISFKFSK